LKQIWAKSWQNPISTNKPDVVFLPVISATRRHKEETCGPGLTKQKHQTISEK
jgi:hypothetical protein